MIILDTNIISELTKPTPSNNVMAWFDSLDMQPIAISAITIAELKFGLENLPDGKRKSDLGERLDRVIGQFGSLALPVDADVAQAYGLLAAKLKRGGHTIGLADTMIAATVQLHQAKLATRNTRHFERCGIEVVNPFNFAA